MLPATEMLTQITFGVQ